MFQVLSASGLGFGDEDAQMMKSANIPKSEALLLPSGKGSQLMVPGSRSGSFWVGLGAPGMWTALAVLLFTA